MLESGLFFTLGFLCAGLLALMVAPAIWRRAVVLTRQRIESSVPLALNEIQADKDQLRAEFAMSTRRLEVSLEGLKERAAEQLIEINRRRDEMLSLEDEHQRKSQRIADLETQGAELRAELRGREEKLNAATAKLSAVEIKLEEKALAFEELDERYRSAVDEFDGRKIEMVARETRLDSLVDETADMRRDLAEAREINAAQAAELKASIAARTRLEKRVEDANKQIVTLQSRLSDMEARVERRDGDLASLRNASGGTSAQLGDVQKRLDEALSERMALEADLANTRLRLEQVMEQGAEGRDDSALAAFEQERKTLRRQVETLEAERDRLRADLAAQHTASGDEWDAERREHALVRERINDLAAQVTAMTAALEGPDSPIHAALKPGRGDTARRKLAAGGDDADLTLADRIRALQDAAERAAAS